LAVLVGAQPGAEVSVPPAIARLVAALRVDAFFVGVVDIQHHVGGGRLAVRLVDGPGDNEWLAGFVGTSNGGLPAQVGGRFGCAAPLAGRQDRALPASRVLARRERGYKNEREEEGERNTH